MNFHHTVSLFVNMVRIGDSHDFYGEKFEL